MEAEGKQKSRSLTLVARRHPLLLEVSLQSPKVRLPESQQAAAILNADWTGQRRAGFLVKLRPRETRGRDCARTGRWIVRRSGCEASRAWTATRKVTFY